MRVFIRIVSFILLLLALCSPALLASVGLDGEEVVFRLKREGVGRVFLVGDFNGWNPTIDRLADVDGAFEIRLFLLPGRYRYRFIADGVSMPDPDNPHTDEQGNSFFILREIEGTFRIVYSETVDRVGLARAVESRFSGRTYLVAERDGGSLLFSGNVLGNINERAELDLDVGFEYDVPESGTAKGKAFLMRGAAGYRFETGLLGAFYRSRELDKGEPVPLFGTVGPFAYPLGLFCRGAEYDGKPVLGIEVRLFYASRIQGYRTGLETAPDTAAVDDGSNIFADRDLTDSDLMGFRLGKDFGRFEFAYLFRRDYRPKRGLWKLPGSGDYLFRGHEKDFFNGFWLTFVGSGNVTFDAECLWGNSFLTANEQSIDGSGEFEGIEEMHQIWEKGHRMYTGVDFRQNRWGFRAAYTQTTLEGEKYFREGRSDGIHDELYGSVSLILDRLRCTLSGKVESFSATNTGEIFWIQRTNFWLDGDELVTGLFPFLYSTSLYEIKAEFLWDEEEEFAYPYRKALDISLLERRDGSGSDRVVRELQVSKGFPLHRHFNLLGDIRYIHYDHEEWDGKKDFFNAFISIYGGITAESWYSIGVGVNPFIFDRWYYLFSNHGREDYLLGRGLFDVYQTSSTAELMNALKEAEKSLSEEWTITIEAGIRF